MYCVRSRLLVLCLLIWLGGLAEVASAQHKYIFPQFTFGGDWNSTLMVQASGTPTTCTFSAQDRFLTMRDLSGNNILGTSITETFGSNGWTILKTATPQGMAVSSGMAVLDCSAEVSANTLFSLEVGGSLFAEAVVKSTDRGSGSSGRCGWTSDRKYYGAHRGERLPSGFCGRACHNTDRTYRTGCDGGYRVALCYWLEVHRTGVHHYSGDSVSSNRSNAGHSVFFQRHVDRPHHQQYCRDTDWHGDRHAHANWFVPFWYVVYGLS